ncbi:uncharacterized protein LOC126881242 [Diabrotica virgifera virgifera]|uniref:Uncharacterized protein LOC114340078 n=1 Tax=Diabrotica virgifera virgifera TaxID=50390 RepID=A0A6P7GN44_DIAVI|nr:uncharacterized protein LOC126881242 [Diabrotica virgifera virgifera]
MKTWFQLVCSERKLKNFEMRRNVKVLVVLSAAWMFVVVFYLQNNRELKSLGIAYSHAVCIKYNLAAVLHRCRRNYNKVLRPNTSSQQRLRGAEVPPRPEDGNGDPSTDAKDK